MVFVLGVGVLVLWVAVVLKTLINCTVLCPSLRLRRYISETVQDRAYSHDKLLIGSHILQPEYELPSSTAANIYNQHLGFSSDSEETDN